MKTTYHPGFGNRKSKRKNRLSLVIITLLLIFVAGGWFAYKVLFGANVYVLNNSQASIYIPTGSTFEDVKHILYSKGYIIHRKNFELVVNLKKYDKSVKPGHYLIANNMNNIDLVNKLRSGNQDPVKVIFNNVRFAEELAGRISHQIEADSMSLITLMRDRDFLDSLGVTPENIFSLMIPNTYEFYWTTSPKAFMKRMKVEANAFWNNGRDDKAKRMNFNRHDVITLASIVEKETNKDDERARVAGVYLNRLQQGWLLEADPTLVFAHGNFEIKRVLNYHKQIDSPYNTYMYKGLPPGPICLPSVSSIDAVLNAESHNYMFFCAREDFSGYHNFATNLEQHLVNARKYQAELSRRNIFN